MRPAVNRAVKEFLKTTTLHGFKYFCSTHLCDRVGWAVCCCASACCAGMLCTVLWARFMQVPTLLSLIDARDAGLTQVPLVSICPSSARVAQLFAQKMINPGQAHNVNLPALFDSLLGGQSLTPAHLLFLDQILTQHKLTLTEALMNVSEPCHSLVRTCRWRDEDCKNAIQKDITEFGVCCLIRPRELEATINVISSYKSNNPKLALLLQCFDGSINNGYNHKFYTRYPGEEWVSPIPLATGYNYRAQITYTVVLDSSQERLVDGNCRSEPDYTRRRCLINCKEKKCGCRNPLQRNASNSILPACSLKRLNCLKAFNLIEESCDCPTSCREIIAATSVESTPIIDDIADTFDPIVREADASSTVLSVIVRDRSSKVFDLLYTETWWSLLSSLGGVFNMFIGLGLFSALEMIFVVQRLLVALRRSTELAIPTPVPATITITAVD